MLSQAKSWLSRKKKVCHGVRWRHAALIASLAIAGCTSTSTQVTTGFYDVQGNTAKRIDREIRRKGPANGHALAQAAIRFQPVAIKPEVGSRGCRFTDVKFKVIANITLPRWRNRSGASRQLKRAFDNLSQYAKWHENQHVRIAELAARDIEKSFKAMKPSKTCKRLERRSVALFKRKLANHDKAQKAFDAFEQKRLAKIFGTS